MHTCILCNQPDQGKQSDHLRTLYNRSGTLDPGYYRPQLSDNEMRSVRGLVHGEAPICSNRRACRRRQRIGM